MSLLRYISHQSTVDFSTLPLLRMQIDGLGEAVKFVSENHWAHPLLYTPRVRQPFSLRFPEEPPSHEVGNETLVVQISPTSEDRIVNISVVGTQATLKHLLRRPGHNVLLAGALRQPAEVEQVAVKQSDRRSNLSQAVVSSSDEVVCDITAPLQSARSAGNLNEMAADAKQRLVANMKQSMLRKKSTGRQTERLELYTNTGNVAGNSGYAAAVGSTASDIELDSVSATVMERPQGSVAHQHNILCQESGSTSGLRMDGDKNAAGEITLHGLDVTNASHKLSLSAECTGAISVQDSATVHPQKQELTKAAVNNTVSSKLQKIETSTITFRDLHLGAGIRRLGLLALPIPLSPTADAVPQTDPRRMKCSSHQHHVVDLKVLYYETQLQTSKTSDVVVAETNELVNVENVTLSVAERCIVSKDNKEIIDMLAGGDSDLKIETRTVISSKATDMCSCNNESVVVLSTDDKDVNVHGKNTVDSVSCAADNDRNIAALPTTISSRSVGSNQSTAWQVLEPNQQAATNTVDRCDSRTVIIRQQVDGSEETSSGQFKADCQPFHPRGSASSDLPSGHTAVNAEASVVSYNIKPLVSSRLTDSTPVSHLKSAKSPVNLLNIIPVLPSLDQVVHPTLPHMQHLAKPLPVQLWLDRPSNALPWPNMQSCQAPCIPRYQNAVFTQPLLGYQNDFYNIRPLLSYQCPPAVTVPHWIGLQAGTQPFQNALTAVPIAAPSQLYQDNTFQMQQLTPPAFNTFSNTDSTPTSHASSPFAVLTASAAVAANDQPCHDCSNSKTIDETASSRFTEAALHNSARDAVDVKVKPVLSSYDHSVEPSSRTVSESLGSTCIADVLVDQQQLPMDSSYNSELATQHPLVSSTEQELDCDSRSIDKSINAIDSLTHLRELTDSVSAEQVLEVIVIDDDDDDEVTVVDSISRHPSLTNHHSHTSDTRLSSKRCHDATVDSVDDKKKKKKTKKNKRFIDHDAVSKHDKVAKQPKESHSSRNSHKSSSTKTCHGRSRSDCRKHITHSQQHIKPSDNSSSSKIASVDLEEGELVDSGVHNDLGHLLHLKNADKQRDLRRGIQDKLQMSPSKLTKTLSSSRSVVSYDDLNGSGDCCEGIVSAVTSKLASSDLRQLLQQKNADRDARHEARVDATDRQPSGDCSSLKEVKTELQLDDVLGSKDVGVENVGNRQHSMNTDSNSELEDGELVSSSDTELKAIHSHRSHSRHDHKHRSYSRSHRCRSRH